MVRRGGCARAAELAQALTLKGRTVRKVGREMRAPLTCRAHRVVGEPVLDDAMLELALKKCEPCMPSLVQPRAIVRPLRSERESAAAPPGAL